MSETIKTTQHYYTKEFGSYNQSEDNFVANQEITVTITLKEYRELVEKNAKAQNRIDKAESDRYSRNQEIEEKSKEITQLKTKLYEMSEVTNRENDEPCKSGGF